MKKLLLMALAVIALAACKDDASINGTSDAFLKTTTVCTLCNDYDNAATLPVTTVSGDITSSTTWDNGHVWEISGVVCVKNNATLTIEAGTFIMASATAGDPNGVLVITKTGQINAVGCDTCPIVFTSYKLLDNDSGTTPEAGDFGGVILLGDAPVNTGSTTNVIEGLDDQTPVSDFYFGGSNASHNAGTMQYVRIEFGGRDLSGPNSGDEVNGLTLGAVGSGTTLDHIQVSYGLDDAFEFFGGTVNASYLIAFAQEDDGLDFDWGYTGTIEYALVLADKDGTHSVDGNGNADSNGIELDNDGSGSSNTPITNPEIYYLSVIGVSSATDAQAFENGAHIRRNGRIIMEDAVITGYGQDAITPETWAIYIQSPSAKGSCSFDNVGVYAHRTSPFTDPSSISGVSELANINGGMTQPFFNDGDLDFSGYVGAFVEKDWASSACWVKFNF